MALVCRDFYWHVFPFLFENVYICRYDAKRDKAPPNFLALCRSIVVGDERARSLAAYVKRCAIVAYDVDRNYGFVLQDEEQELFILSTAVAYMSNLHELYLWRTSITSDLVSSTTILPSLKLLRLETGCDILKPLELTLLKDLSPLRVTHVIVKGVGFFDPMTKEGRALRRLWLSSAERLTCDGIYDTFCRALESLHPMLNLQYLHLISVSIDTARPKTLSDALAGMSSLKSLHISRINYRREELIFSRAEDTFVFEPCTSFPKLPLLEHIHAPIPALQAMVPSSHIFSIGISSEYLEPSSPVPYPNDVAFWAQCAGVFNKSKSPITVLDIPFAFYHSVPIAELFPELRHLTIRPAHYNWHLNDISPDDIWHEHVMPTFWEEPDLVCITLV